MQYNKKSVEDIDVSGKKVIARCDFNVPLKNGVITDENRIMRLCPQLKSSLPTAAELFFAHTSVSRRASLSRSFL